MSENELKLNNGFVIPQAGFGTIGQSGEEIIDNVTYALNHGYRLIDTANRYGNETEVGEGLRKSGLKREDYFIETKLGPTLYDNENAIDDTLARLHVDYIDVMLLHHPVNNYIHAWHMLEKAYQQGKIRAIGLSNFPVEKIQEVIASSDTVPALMQVECHPYYPADAVRPFLKEKGIRLQAWYPLGHGNADLIHDPVIVQIAENHQKSPVQVILRWHLQMGFGFVPGSHSKAHISSNADIFDFSLAEEEMKEINALDKHEPFYHVTQESLHRMAVTKCNFEK